MNIRSLIPNMVGFLLVWWILNSSNTFLNLNASPKLLSWDYCYLTIIWKNSKEKVMNTDTCYYVIISCSCYFQMKKKGKKNYLIRVYFLQSLSTRKNNSVILIFGFGLPDIRRRSWKLDAIYFLQKRNTLMNFKNAKSM